MLFASSNFVKKFTIRFMTIVLLSVISCKSTQPASSSRELGTDTDPSNRSRNSQNNLPEFKMTSELPDVTRRLTNILNTCWLQAGVKELEFAQYKKSGNSIALSTEYMMMSALHERFFRIIQGAKIRSAELEAGGEMNEVRQLILRYGIMPEKTWSQPAKDWGEMARKLNAIGAEYRQRFREYNKNGKDTKPLTAAAEQDFQAMLKSYNVHQPTWFMHNGKKTTPREFAKYFANEYPEDYVMFLARSQFPEKPTKEFLQTVQNGFLTSWENIEKSIIYEITQKRSVLLSIHWSNKGIKTTDGIMRVIEKPLTGDLVGHVVNIVGYHLNKQGRIDRVKIENTWGRYEGSSGFYSVSWDDLKTMYVAISIPDGFNFANAQKMNGEKLVD